MLIVAAGVWLAIVVGNRASEAQHQARAKATLRSVLGELDQDEAEIREVLAAQRQNLQTVLEVAAAVRKPQPEDSVVGRLITRTFKGNRTFFPRRAAYSIMVNAGQLEDIADPHLRLALAELYDHDYVRVANAGRLSDDVAFGFRNVSLEVWDYQAGRMLPDPALLKMSNMCHRMQIFTNFYTTVLEDEARTVENARRRVRAYLDGDAASS